MILTSIVTLCYIGGLYMGWYLRGLYDYKMNELKREILENEPYVDVTMYGFKGW